ncbi:hypothetical protein A3B87_01105 [Candidatus Kuenenbacteria bacterium RIFCSPHIGHO2_02_FULL_39_13]|uniref:ATP-cone domain-containing protein n=1 Tax=Candidatus Kuenenbacteria bacterium RIFCSPHIGHO2_02_FULL_39_13 TaxID=1798561 RepID=A0A1F6FLL3_9BACT|nr:MAG: hypothetical protein A3B87_01105 [Candidatus Kuenenbacteria bacterium RIFCSPHIGHO2_02_FULL_39_13]
MSRENFFNIATEISPVDGRVRTKETRKNYTTEGGIVVSKVVRDFVCNKMSGADDEEIDKLVTAIVTKANDRGLVNREKVEDLAKEMLDKAQVEQSGS